MPSIKKVAEIAGVSTATVSRVLNATTNGAAVREETADRVRLAAARINYRGNYHVAAMRRGRADVIGFTMHPSDIARPDVVEVTYEGTPLSAVLSLFEGIEDVALGLPEIRCPVLLFSSREDHVVPSTSGDLVEASVGGPCERVWLERSYHVATLDYDRDEIEDRAVSFVTAVTAGAVP